MKDSQKLALLRKHVHKQIIKAKQQFEKADPYAKLQFDGNIKAFRQVMRMIDKLENSKGDEIND